MKDALDPHGILNPGKLGLPSPFGAGAVAVTDAQRWDWRRPPGRRRPSRSCSPCRSRSPPAWAADSRRRHRLAVVAQRSAPCVGFVLGAGCAAWVQRVGTAAQPRHRHRGRHLPRRPGRVRRRPPASAASDVRLVRRRCSTSPSSLVAGLARRPARPAAATAGACCPRTANEEPRDHDPRHRRRHDQPAGRRRRRATSPSSHIERPAVPADDAVPRARRVRRRRAGARWCSTPPRACIAAAGEPGRRRRHHQPAGQRRSCGTARPASRSARRSAGRTCARSIECIVAKAEHGLPLAPNQSATKLAWLLDQRRRRRDRDLCFGTVDTWLAWALSGGARPRHRPHQRRRHRPARAPTASGWNDGVLRALGIPMAMLPAIVDSTRRRRRGHARSPGAPPIAALVGDQQASLVGQGCVAPGLGEDHVRHRRDARRLHRRRRAPASASRLRPRHVPDRRLVAAAASSRGASRRSCCRPARNVEWLRDDLGLIDTGADSHDVAAAVRRHRRRRLRAGAARPRHAAVGLRRPRHAARPHPRARTRAHVVRAVLEGVAHRGADLVEAAEADTGLHDRDAARRRRDERQPDVRPGARRRDRPAGRGLPRRRGDDARRRRSSPASPSACGTTPGRPPRCGARPVGWNRRPTSPRCGSSAGPSGTTPSVAPAAGSPSCPPSSSEGTPPEVQPIAGRGYLPWIHRIFKLSDDQSSDD